MGPDISAAHAPAGLTMWRKTAEASGKDLLAEVIAGVVTRLREMPRHVAPSTIPTMAAMMTAAAMPASPTLSWRPQSPPVNSEQRRSFRGSSLSPTQSLCTGPGQARRTRYQQA